MIFKQFYLNCLAHASYLIGDEQTRTAAVVDPRRDVELYIDEAARLGLQIRHVFLTHFHADFVAGHLELRDRTGATIHLGASATAEYPFTPMKDGDAVEFGRVRLEVLQTPGHTAESISILVYDLANTSSRPHAVLTGDTLFVGDVGRPDLRASLGWSASALGGLLFESLHRKLMPLPDETLVYPAHGAGSLCGKSLSTETVSTIGEQRRSNYALQPMAPEQFVKLVTADQPEAPAYFTYDAVLNTRERETLDAMLHRTLKPLSLTQVLEMRDAGAELLDVREPSEFAAAHLAGALNIGLNGQYATWAGTLVDRERPIVLIAAPGRETEAATRLGRIGFDNIAGYLEGGMQAVGETRHLAMTEEVIPSAAATLLGSPDAPLVLDVRTPREWQSGHVRGSLNVPLNQLLDRLDDVPPDRPVVVVCAGGYRSSIAASLLQRQGFDQLVSVRGGMAAWQAGGLPIEQAAA